MQGEEGVVVRGRVEIDMRQPFRSVREAVMLFGEKVLAGEVYGNKLKEMQSSVQHEYPRIGQVKAELEETKQSLEKAKEEGTLMAHCLNSLREELEHTKRELHKLKSRETTLLRHDHDRHLDKPEIEELKFVENAKTKLVEIVDVSTPQERVEFQKKRSVKFASPLMTKVIGSEGEKKEKKKPLVPLIGGLFLMKKIKKTKGGKESES